MSVMVKNIIETLNLVILCYSCKMWKLPILLPMCLILKLKGVFTKLGLATFFETWWTQCYSLILNNYVIVFLIV